jgi:hypothetical protein
MSSKIKLVPEKPKHKLNDYLESQSQVQQTQSAQVNEPLLNICQKQISLIKDGTVKKIANPSELKTEKRQSKTSREMMSFSTN